MKCLVLVCGSLALLLFSNYAEGNSTTTVPPPASTTVPPPASTTVPPPASTLLTTPLATTMQATTAGNGGGHVMGSLTLLFGCVFLQSLWQ